MKLITNLIFILAAILSWQVRADSIAEAVNLIARDQRKIAFLKLEKIFNASSGATKKQAAELLTSAFAGETKEDPGFYAEYIVNSDAFASAKLEDQLRFLRLSGDYYLKKAKYDLADKRYDELASKGGRDEKDFSEYKKAWVLLNKNQHREAVEQLSNLSNTSPNSKLKLSIAFDLGRFWGESKPADQDPKAVDKVLKSAEERKEFFRGLQKTLVLPKKKQDRIVLKSKSSEFKDSYQLIELDLKSSSASRELACEKLFWAQYKEQMAKIKSDAPYKMLLQCFGNSQGEMRKLSSNEQKSVVGFLSTLTATQNADVLHKARFLTNLNDHGTACHEYSVYFSTPNINADTALCEEASEVCFKALENASAVSDAALLFERAFSCSSKTASSKSLRLAGRLYEVNPNSLESFIGNPKNAALLGQSLIPDVLYEGALKKKDEAYAQKIAKRFFFEKSTVSAERKKSLEHYLGQNKLKASELKFDQIASLYPLKGASGFIKDNLDVWVNAARANKKDGALSELLEACNDAKLQLSGHVGLRTYCVEFAPVNVAWNWVHAKLNCNTNSDALLVLNTWIALDKNTNAKLGATYEKSFVKDAYSAYSSKQYSKATKIMGSECPKKFAINEHLKNLTEIHAAATQPVVTSSALTRTISFVKAKIKTTPNLAHVDDTLTNSAKTELIAVIENMEKGMSVIELKEPEAAKVLGEFKNVFASWKKELK
jgi:hypothetical protein